MQVKNLEFLGFPYHYINEAGDLHTVDQVCNSRYGAKKRMKGKAIKQHIGANGYKQVTFCHNNKYKAFSVHRILALCFIPNPDNLPSVNHKTATS